MSQKTGELLSVENSHLVSKFSEEKNNFPSQHLHSNGDSACFTPQSHLLVSTSQPGIQPSSLSKRHCQLYLPEKPLPCVTLYLKHLTCHSGPSTIFPQVISQPELSLLFSVIYSKRAAHWHLCCVALQLQEAELTQCCLQWMDMYVGTTEAKKLSLAAMCLCLIHRDAIQNTTLGTCLF